MGASTVWRHSILHLNPRSFWVEVKAKADATFNNKHQRWTVGCAQRLWECYKVVQDVTRIPVEVFFWLKKEKEIRGGPIDTLPISHIWHGNQVNLGGTVFLDKNEMLLHEPMMGYFADILTQEGTCS